MEELKNQPCPFCFKKTLTLIEEEKEIPYFGKCYIMSMRCESCNYYKSDIESVEPKDPIKYEFTVKDKKDMNIRVVKGSNATVKIPSLRMSVEPAIASIGYISNIEGVLRRFKKIVENQRDSAEEDSIKKSAKNLLKKIRKVEDGEQEIKLIIEDPTGNSAIISDKAVVSKLKKK
ncbi:ZPR1 zinc finger domain-containing protein [Candidatus Woesearchaeota archaeon]|nr:ZPR1 zinc finger domain-containing protein [Candidatus Woesearchaeota archaeon]